MPTKIVRDSVGHTVDTLEEGEAATHRLVTHPTLDQVSGRFYNRTAEARADQTAYDPNIRHRLWRLSLDLTGAPDPR